MCGIVGGITTRDIAPILLEGLRRLEYRGYDSAGIVTLSDEGLQRRRSVGKVEVLAALLEREPLAGRTGIAHTRWATHGAVSENNAHPHICNSRIAVVHNGIIENHAALKAQQQQQGMRFTSDTDTEVIVHQIYHYEQQGMDLLDAVRSTLRDLRGAYALGVVSTGEPRCLVAARKGSPLVIGVGFDEYFIASDIAALLPVTQRFIHLEDGDIAVLTPEGVKIEDHKGNPVKRVIRESELCAQSADLGRYRHFMHKEIHEQPAVIGETLEGRIGDDGVLIESFGNDAPRIFAETGSVHIIACGTSYHAGMVARYWLEGIAGIPCTVEIASEFRYRKPCVPDNALVVSISQSGETADTLAALEYARETGFAHSLAICNVPESSLVRASDLCLMTRAGPEIGVASTKAFTTQLTALMLLVLALGRSRGLLAREREREIIEQLRHLPLAIERVLGTEKIIARLAERFVEKQDALFLGRGIEYPIAMEGALKLKEISYIHAEAYPAGELKHGPLALVDADMPVIAVAPSDSLLEKIKSNIEEVRARGGELYVFSDHDAGFSETDFLHLISIGEPVEASVTAPILYTIPLQLLAYHVAVMKGTDVDHPRNLAKSVTVE